MLGNEDYKHALRICNTYCLSMAIMVTRTRLNVTFILHIAFLTNGVLESVANSLTETQGAHECTSRP